MNIFYVFIPKHDISYGMHNLHKFPFFLWRNDGAILVRSLLVQGKRKENPKLRMCLQTRIMQQIYRSLVVTKSFGLEMCKV